MKAFVIGLFTLFMGLNAHASYMATHCSNATGSVRWESGHNSNTIELRYYDQGEQAVRLPLLQVQIKFLKETTIEEQVDHRCGFHGKTRTYVGKVMITGSTSFPDSIKNILEEEKLETTVLCTFQVNGRAPCPDQI